SGWQTGNALFYAEESALPAPKNTELLLGPATSRTVSYYFRKTFEFGGSTNGVIFTVSHVVDDGIVIWLNGQIALRFNMPAAGIPKYSDLATVNVDNGVLTGPVRLQITNLVQGVNQLAVELHQQSI